MSRNVLYKCSPFTMHVSKHNQFSSGCILWECGRKNWTGPTFITCKILKSKIICATSNFIVIRLIIIKEQNLCIGCCNTMKKRIEGTNSNQHFEAMKLFPDGVCVAKGFLLTQMTT